MSKRLTMFLSILSGVLLSFAGIFFFFWQPPPEIMGNIPLKAQHMVENFDFNILYIISTVGCCFFFLPVAVTVLIRLNKIYANTIILGTTFLIIGFLLDGIANLYSISWWTEAIPSSVSGDEIGKMLFNTIETGFLALDFTAVAFVYLAALVYGIGFLRSQKLIGYPMMLSFIFFIAAFVFGFYFRIGMIIFMISSFISYGLGLIGLGWICVKTESEGLQ